MSKKEEIEVWWNIFCEKIFQRSKKKNYEDLSELEIKIFCIKTIGGVVNIELIAHSDFPGLAQELDDLGELSIPNIYKSK